MATRFKQHIILILLLFSSLMYANVNPVEPTKPNPSEASETACLLPAPAMFWVNDVGTTWAQLSWTPVSGAFQYLIITRDVPFGNVLNVVYISAAFNSAIITPLPPGTTCQSEIWSVCQNGVSGPTSRFSPEFGTPILDVVDCGIWNTEGLVEDCTMRGPNPINGCEISNVNGVGVAFRVSDVPNSPFNYRFFRVVKDNSLLHVIKHPLTIGNRSWEFELAAGGTKVEVFNNGTSVGHFSTNNPTAGGTKKLYWTDGPTGGNTVIRKMNGSVPGNCEPPEGLIFDGSWVDEVDDSEQYLTATPNPFTNFLDIKIPYATEENDVLMSLYDLQGRLVISIKVPGGNQTQSISTQDLKPGLYFLRVDTGDKSETIKLIKTQ
jgi:Secretion system C-terminal sorting domain